MEVDVRRIGKTTLKVAGIACVATGLVVASAVIASSAAVCPVVRRLYDGKKGCYRYI